MNTLGTKLLFLVGRGRGQVVIGIKVNMSASYAVIPGIGLGLVFQCLRQVLI